MNYIAKGGAKSMENVQEVSITQMLAPKEG
jgi:hypothetical protein